MQPDAGIADVPFVPTLFVCAGNEPMQHVRRRLLHWLRRLDRHGALLGAIDTGAFTLAEAGLLEGRRISLHWEAIASFHERYPEIAVEEQLFVSDQHRMTCAGGIATLDMMLELIALRHGRGLSEIVKNGFVHERTRRGFEPQRVSAADAIAGIDHRLAGIVADMERNLDAPLSPEQLARRGGLSVRQLERLMRARFDDTPSGYYLKLRLQAARNQLFYSDTPVQEVALATGFSSPSVLSRCFKARFGLSPREFRRQFSGDRLQRFRPEVRQQLGPAQPEAPTA
jgi:AraC family carnitine catabolism transcriptional activator